MVNVCSNSSRSTDVSTDSGSSPSAEPKLPLDDQMRPSNSSSDVSRQ